MIPYFDITGWQIGFLKIQSWGLMVSFGFLIGFIIVWKLVKRQKLNQEVFLNLFIWILIGAILGGRLFYILFENSWNFYFQHPLEILKIWQGGLDSFGGFFGVFLVIYWFWRKKKINWQYLDILAFAFPFGWVVGRVGCFLIHDHLGVLNDSFLAINFPSGGRLDMALLEILMLLPLLVIFAWKGQKLLFKPALLSSWLFLWYGIGRFFLDFWRARDIGFPDARYWGLTVAQWGCIMLIVFGLSLLKKRFNGGVA